MADPVRLDFGQGSDSGRYGPDAGPMHWNCYVEPVSGGKHPAPVYSHDGFVAFASSTAANPSRGMIAVGSDTYQLAGSTLSKISSSGVRTAVGGIAGTARAIMARNSKSGSPQIVIVIDGERFVVESDTISPINDTDLPPPNSVTFLNRKIIFGINDGRFLWSAVNEATDISSLDFTEAEGSPDNLVRVIAHLQELWALGAETIEVFYDTGDGFQRRTGTVIPKGCIGAHTVAQLDLDLLWVGNDGVVYMARGLGFNRVSNHAVERSIRETADKSAIAGWTYFRDGSAFYVLAGPDWTWQYNRTYNHWNPRFSYGSSRWVADGAVQINNEWIVGSNASDALYRLSASAYDEAGTTMVWRARSAPMHAYPSRMSVYRLHLDFVTGVGLNSSDAHESAPQAGLRYSDDGGFTWSNQRLKPLGATGKRTTRVVFDGLGITGRTGRIWEIEVSSPVVRAMTYAAIEADPIGT